MGKFALMLKKEQEAEAKRKAQGVTYPTQQKVIAPKAGAENTAPIITWKQDGEVKVKANDQKIANQTKIREMESVINEPNFKDISMQGGQRWKTDKAKADTLLRDPGYRKFQEYLRKNNFAGTLEGVSGMQLMLGENNDRFMPQTIWTFDQNNIFNYYYKTNPEHAKAYAAAINDEYTRANEERLADWAVKNQAVAEAGAWVMDRIAPAETMDTELTYAQTGRLPYTTQVTPGRYSTIVRDVIRKDMDETSGDRVVGTVGAAMEDVVNSALYDYYQKIGGPLGMAAGAVESYSQSYNDALYDALSRGATEEEAIQYARRVGLSGAAGSVVSNYLNKKLPDEKAVGGSVFKESMTNATGEMLKGILNQEIDYRYMGTNNRYNGIVKAYTSAGYTQEKAEDMAWQILGRELVSNLSNSLLSGMIYGLGVSDNSLKRNLFK